MKLGRISAIGAIGIGILALAQGPAEALTMAITGDEVIFVNGDVPDPTKLTGAIEMTANDGSNHLQITLTNTSVAGAASTAASRLLTGLGFNLGAGFSITGGTAAIAAGSVALNFDGTGDLGKEWGWDNGPLGSGPFQPSPAGYVLGGSVDAVISTLAAAVNDGQFTAGSLDASGIGGPSFGLLSGSEAASAAGGQAAVQDSILFDLTLNQAIANAAAFLGGIETGHVVLSFGSPAGTPGTDIQTPEPASLAVMALGLAGLGAARRRRR